MAEVELETSLNHVEKQRRLHFEWVIPLFLRPRRSLKTIVTRENAVWQTPLLILSVLAIVLVLVGGPLRAVEAQQVGELPPDFQYWTPEQQEEYMSSQANRANPIFIYLFPALGSLIGIWLSWLLLGSFLHLALTLSGSRGINTQALNLAGWASLPFALRYIVQAIAILTNNSLITAPGLSGFVAADAEGLAVYLRFLLTFIDIYLIWQVALLMTGSLPLTGLPRRKAWPAVILSVVLLLLLQAVPGYVGQLLSGLDISGGIYF